jgi:hypothetical protein
MSPRSVFSPSSGSRDRAVAPLFYGVSLRQAETNLVSCGFFLTAIIVLC